MDVILPITAIFVSLIGLVISEARLRLEVRKIQSEQIKLDVKYIESFYTIKHDSYLFFIKLNVLNKSSTSNCINQIKAYMDAKFDDDYHPLILSSHNNEQIDDHKGTSPQQLPVTINSGNSVTRWYSLKVDSHLHRFKNLKIGVLDKYDREKIITISYIPQK